MPFGLHGAPATFQRLIDTVLADCATFSLAYLEDIIIFSPMWEQHLQHLWAVLDQLQEAGLRINPRNSKLAFGKLHYLGYLVNYGLLQPQENKVKAIQDVPQPLTKLQNHCFLGLAGY